ncbi:MAG: hypothetical protein BWY25_03063 [Chloroflexi bacterium ADurb.Bin222]|nr:MAG: hypothetical protein BWY25_03063 [Chloroflexi bacterium ADurb.Bin222]
MRQASAASQQHLVYRRLRYLADGVAGSRAGDEHRGVEADAGSRRRRSSRGGRPQGGSPRGNRESRGARWQRGGRGGKRSHGRAAHPGDSPTAPVEPSRPTPVRFARATAPRGAGRGYGRKHFRAAQIQPGTRRARNSALPSQQSAAFPIRSARPGLLSGWAIHTGERSRHAVRSRIHQEDRLQHGPQAC